MLNQIQTALGTIMGVLDIGEQGGNGIIKLVEFLYVGGQFFLSLLKKFIGQ